MILLAIFIFSLDIASGLPLNDAPVKTPTYDLELLFAPLPTFLVKTLQPIKHVEKSLRYQGFKEAIKLIITRDAKVLVELGTARSGAKNCNGDGCSTIEFGHIAHLYHLKLFSIDKVPEYCIRAKEAVKEYQDSVEVITSDSIVFLKNFDKDFIDFLYIDSQDYDKDVKPAQQRYLEEIKAAYPKLHKKSIVMVDDCDSRRGNCNLVREYLISEGWKVHLEGYQDIYLYE